MDRNRIYIITLVWIWTGFLFLHSIYPTAQAQNYRSYSFGINHGLPTYFAKSINQDSLGYIWVATDDGLARYNGKTFDVFDDELPSRYVKIVFRGNDGTIYIATDMGIVQLMHGKGKPRFSPFLNGSSQPTDSTIHFPRNLFQDQSGTFWISEPGAVVRYQPGIDSLHRYFLPEKHRSSSYLHAFHVFEEHGNIYVLTYHNGVLYRFNREKKELQKLPVSIPQSRFDVEGVVTLDDGALLAATANGIYRLDYQNGAYRNSWSKMLNLENALTLARFGDTIYLGTRDGKIYLTEASRPDHLHLIQEGLYLEGLNHIFKDRYGAIWTASDRGITLVHPTRFQPLIYPTEVKVTNNLALGRDGNLYAAVENRLYRINETNAHIEFENIASVPDDNIWSIAQSGNRLWTGTDRGKIYYWRDNRMQSIHLQSPSSRINKAVFNMIPDPVGNGIFAILDQTQGLFRIDEVGNKTHLKEPFLASEQILSIQSTDYGELYATARQQIPRIYHFNREKETFEAISIPVDTVSAEDIYFFHDFHSPRENLFYLLSTRGILELKIDGGQKQVRWIREFGGLDFELSRSIYATSPENIIVGAENGIFELNHGDFIRYNLSDGLPSSTVTYRSLLKDSSGRLWTGTYHGLAYTEELGVKEEVTPQPEILDIAVAGNNLNDYTNLKVEEHVKSVISFQSLIYPSSKTHYRYRFKNSGRRWSHYSSISTVNTETLSSGTYTLQIQAHYGIYQPSKITSLPITIRPPWYKSWYAIIVYFFLGISLFAFIVRFRTNVKEKRWTLEQLRRTEQRLSTIISHTPIVLFVIDSDGYLTLLEGRVLKSLNIIPEKLLGHHISELNELWVDEKQFEQAFRGKPVEYTSERHGLTISTQLNPLFNRNRTATGVIGVSTDITYRILIEHELRNAKEMAESANRAKSTFLANMSHELRTPLNAIIGYAQILQQNRSLDSKSKEYIRTMHKSGEHLLGMINDILDLTKIETGHMTYKSEVFDLSSFLEDIYQMFKLRADDKQLDFTYQLDENLPQVIKADVHKLRQVLINLISNAIKYTPTGKVELSVLPKESDKQEKFQAPQLVFKVSDTTKRILKKYLPLLNKLRKTRRKVLGLDSPSLLILSV